MGTLRFEHHLSRRAVLWVENSSGSPGGLSETGIAGPSLVSDLLKRICISNRFLGKAEWQVGVHTLGSIVLKEGTKSRGPPVWEQCGNGAPLTLLNGLVDLVFGLQFPISQVSGLDLMN